MLYITRFAADWRFYAALSLGVIFSICLHEFCHAWVALRQGDPTAADRGHLTLNPLKQMGLWSLVMFAMVGIAWGQVPVNPGRMRHRWSPALVAASGPLANLGLFCIFAAVTAFLYLAGNEQPFAVRIFLHIAMMNSILFILNMLPVPGLDGWTVLGYFFPKIHRTDSEWINGVSLVMLVLVFTGFRYIAAVGGTLTLLTVQGLVNLLGGA